MGAIRKAALHGRPNFPGLEADSSVRLPGGCGTAEDACIVHGPAVHMRP